MSDTTNALSTSTVGEHSELLAQAALLADGWTVHKPITPEAHDLLAVKGGNVLRIQVKTIKLRERDDAAYYVIRGLKNNGTVYSQTDCDAFIGVIGEHVYLTVNRALTEYWCRADEVGERWRHLPLRITKPELVN